jgi:uncharacterized protein YndB with AHSA1/START domain
VTAIQEQAPIVAGAEIEIEAEPSEVWEVLSDIERWPSWNPEVKSASLEGELTEGAEFHWKAGSFRINSTIRYLEPPYTIVWTGRMMGIDAVHVWRLEDEDGATLIRTEESWSGLWARLFRRPLVRVLVRSLGTGLVRLKDAVEGGGG